MSPYVRTVKAASGTRAAQIVHSSRRGSPDIEHIGSAHGDAELEVLKAGSAGTSHDMRQRRRAEAQRPCQLAESSGQAAVQATPTGHVIPLGPWLRYPSGFSTLAEGAVLELPPKPMGPSHHRSAVDQGRVARGPVLVWHREVKTPADVGGELRLREVVAPDDVAIAGCRVPEPDAAVHAPDEPGVQTGRLRRGFASPPKGRISHLAMMADTPGTRQQRQCAVVRP